VYCVAFWFTRRADSFRGFVGNPERHEPWVNNSDSRKKKSSVKPTNGSVVVLRGTRED
jgi:hypothetical protein